CMNPQPYSKVDHLREVDLREQLLIKMQGQTIAEPITNDIVAANICRVFVVSRIFIDIKPDAQRASKIRLLSSIEWSLRRHPWHGINCSVKQGDPKAVGATHPRYDCVSRRQPKVKVDDDHIGGKASSRKSNGVRRGC